MSSILEEIETKIEGLKTATTKSNVGVVRETGDGVARIEGLSDVMLSEMIEFPNGVFGLALNLEETEVGAILIDAFERGSIVTEEDCRQKLDAIYSGQLALQPEFLLPVTRRQMLTRMLNNLRSIYLSQRDFRRAVQIVDLILVIYPRSPEDVKQRAVLRYNLNDYRGALNDFEEYVKMSPDASDAEEIKQTALSLRRSMAMMN